MKICTLILALLGCAGLVAAQTPSSAAPARPQPHTGTQSAAPAETPGSAKSQASAEKVDPAKEERIRHLMDITQTSKLGDNIASYIISQVRSAANQTVGEAAAPKFMESFSQQFNASASAAAVTDAMVPIYARAFSMEDINSLIQFYESPLGQRVVKALPDVVQQSQTQGVEIEQTAALKVLRGMTTDYPDLKKILPPEGGEPAAPGSAAPAPEERPAPTPTPKSSTAPSTPK